jgi:hypothetical protein
VASKKAVGRSSRRASENDAAESDRGSEDAYGGLDAEP